MSAYQLFVLCLVLGGITGTLFTIGMRLTALHSLNATLTRIEHVLRVIESKKKE